MVMALERGVSANPTNPSWAFSTIRLHATGLSSACFILIVSQKKFLLTSMCAYVGDPSSTLGRLFPFCERIWELSALGFCSS
jgi:hypothetical protein